jgi:cytochrome c oxidase subunit 2
MTDWIYRFFSLWVVQQGGSLWMPARASLTADYVDDLFYFILYLSIFFFVLIVATMLVFVFKYRRKSETQKTSPLHGNRTLEVAWSLIPALLLIVIFVWGFRGFLAMNIPPRNALEIRVTGQKWSWSFSYPKQGVVVPDLVVPVGRPVKLVMSSQDVIHSFFVPAFRIKKDVLPNRYTVAWFEPTETGEFHVFCTEYCGTGHSTMLSKVTVKSEREFEEWISTGGGMAGLGGVEMGKQLVQSQGCVACHSVDGSKLLAPSLKGMFGKQEKLVGGEAISVDDNYIRESITDPALKVVEGFQPIMPTYKGRLKDVQIDAIIDYIKSLE